VAEHVKKVHKVPTATTTITDFLKEKMRRT